MVASLFAEVFLNLSPKKPRFRSLAFLSCVTLLGLSSIAQSEPSRQRVDWDKLSPEQQAAIKASGIQGKEVTAPPQSYYVYQKEQRTPVTVQGAGANAVFRMEGAGSDLRHSGRGLISLSANKPSGDLKVALERFGIQLGRSIDPAGLIWTVQTPPGLEGLKSLNQLKESGIVDSASPDWQRDLKKK
jgi:hypothetical protein